MKKLAIALASIFTVAASVAHAAYDRNGNYYDAYEPGAYDARPMSRSERQDFARVIDSHPVYEAANRKEECWNPRAGHYEERRDANNNDHDANVKGTVAGAVVGGVLGHQVDSGAGGTLGGALLGGIVGNQIERSRNNDNVQNDLDYSRCRVISEGRNLQGYDVRYEYRGREFVARMDHQPPRRLRVGVDIREDGRPF